LSKSPGQSPPRHGGHAPAASVLSAISTGALVHNAVVDRTHCHRSAVAASCQPPGVTFPEQPSKCAFPANTSAESRSREQFVDVRQLASKRGQKLAVLKTAECPLHIFSYMIYDNQRMQRAREASGPCMTKAPLPTCQRKLRIDGTSPVASSHARSQKTITLVVNNHIEYDVSLSSIHPVQGA